MQKTVLTSQEKKRRGVSSNNTINKVVRDSSISSSAFTEKPDLSDPFIPNSENHLTAIEKMLIAKQGITRQYVDGFKEKSKLGNKQLSQILSVSVSSLNSKDVDEKFSPIISERILSIAEVYAYGYEVFEDVESFNNWMQQPNTALGGETPYNLMDNQFGREEVKNVIGRIDYGVYS